MESSITRVYRFDSSNRSYTTQKVGTNVLLVTAPLTAVDMEPGTQGVLN